MALDDKHHDSSDDEKRVTGVEAGAFETLGHGELPPDPDAGLTEPERAAIVCTIHKEAWSALTNHIHRTESSSGSSTSV